MRNRRWLIALGILLLGSVALAQATRPVAARPGGAAYPELIAAGEWSEEVNGLRGRMLLAEGRKRGETVTYLELRHAPEAAGNAIEVQVDPRLTCELRDAQDKVVPAGGAFGSGGLPGPQWVTLSHDATIRLRLSAYGFGSDQGLRITVGMSHWTIKPGDTASFGGTFASDPKEPRREGVWKGTLKLPAMKISGG